jgi:outer membrane protein OmpA-like peptidoglycan-associated protein
MMYLQCWHEKRSGDGNLPSEEQDMSLMRGVRVRSMTRRAISVLAAVVAASGIAAAQSGDGVSVDLGALETPPTASTPLGPVGPDRIVLRPPPGTAAISRAPASGPITLRPPAGDAKAPQPATRARAAAPAKPAPQTAPAPVAAAPAATAAPIPEAPAPSPPPTAAPAAPPVASATSALPRPSAAAAQSATSEPSGPQNTPLARGMSPARDPEPAQTASLPPATQDLSRDETAETISLTFNAGSAQVGGAAAGQVNELAQRMADDRSLRVQLLAYASDPDKNTSKARRMALDRAVAVRNMLIDAGVERTRIEVRALGDQGDAGPADRVDAIAVKR